MEWEVCMWLEFLKMGRKHFTVGGFSRWRRRVWLRRGVVSSQGDWYLRRLIRLLIVRV